jgi:hypothetical protein
MYDGDEMSEEAKESEKPPSSKPSSSRSSSVPPEAKGFVARMKSLATLATALAALIAAGGALLKPADKAAAKASYDTLSLAVKDISEENAKNHDELVKLHAYLDVLYHVQPITPVAIPSASASTAPAATVAPVAPRPSASVAVLAMRPPSPPPEVGPRPPVLDLPTFDQVDQRQRASKPASAKK